MARPRFPTSHELHRFQAAGSSMACGPCCHASRALSVIAPQHHKGHGCRQRTGLPDGWVKGVEGGVHLSGGATCRHMVALCRSQPAAGHVQHPPGGRLWGLPQGQLRQQSQAAERNRAVMPWRGWVRGPSANCWLDEKGQSGRTGRYHARRPGHPRLASKQPTSGVGGPASDVGGAASSASPRANTRSASLLSCSSPCIHSARTRVTEKCSGTRQHLAAACF